MAKSVDNTFNLILLDELVGNSVVLAISLYYVIMNLDVSEIATCCTFIFFAIIALVMLFGYCLIGDQLTQQVLLGGAINNRFVRVTLFTFSIFAFSLFNVQTYIYFV
ncbi:hypothetical protein ALC60_13977 [Trachymyrmex zeteki]|uniref:Uncharacterized protein n=1 Tax=Mycetomoellerius zeteki TaxID=64791 RepID=A0A151WGT4_9HYME|nr:hypothetical protein ALC60_13977 [Trachymyrmex zeteki]